jgi:hypothetical protein
MPGCSVGAIYAAARDIEQFRPSGVIRALVRRAVRAVDRTQREIISENGEHQNSAAFIFAPAASRRPALS